MVRSVTPTLVSVAHSLQTQRRSRGSQRWAFDLEFPAMSRADWAPIFAFLVKQRGRYETFQWTLPTGLVTPRGALGGSPLVDNEVGSPTAVQTGTRSLNTKGWSNNITGVLKAGDFILPTGGSGKVYMVTADCDSGASGLSAVPIEPSLIDAIPHGQAITVTSVPFTVGVARESLESALDLGPQHALSLELVEMV